MRNVIKAAAAAAVLAAGFALPASAATVHAPAWVHVVKTQHRHNGHPCVIVYGGSGDSSALVCSDGYADGS